MTDARRNRPLNAMHQTIVDMAARPQGCTNRDLQAQLAINCRQAGSGLNISVVSGRTVAASHPDDPKHQLHYFTSASTAKAWAAGPAPAAIERKPSAKKLKALEAHKWRPDAGGTAKHTAGPSKMAATAPCAPMRPTKIGAAPAFGIAARYYVDPATVRGPFSLAGIGRDVETGKPWGPAA